MLRRFPIFDLILIAMLAALGTASKVIIGPAIRIVTNSLSIPGGALIGGIYMLWLGLAIGLTRKKGAATLMATVQALMIFVTGAPGSHGLWTFATYIPPGIMCDMVFLVSKGKNYNILHYIVGIALANIVGTLASSSLFFELPLIPLLLALSSAALSGAIGGVIAYFIMANVNKIGLIKSKTIKDNRDE